VSKNLISVSDKLLVAAHYLEESGKRPFSAEDLVVAAWQKYPDTFGLSGYRSRNGSLLYPDSNRVYAEIMGTKPIRERGFLIKVGNKVYQLTQAGREHARLISGLVGEPSPKKAGLGRDIQQELKRLISSKAFEKYRNGQIQDLTFHDACIFWGISPRSSAIEMEGRFANFVRIVDTAREATGGKTVVFEYSGYTYNDTDLQTLLKIHQELMRAFAEEVEVIRKRTDERKTGASI